MDNLTSSELLLRGSFASDKLLKEGHTGKSSVGIRYTYNCSSEKVKT